jgi:hypothetical protein
VPISLSVSLDSLSLDSLSPKIGLPLQAEHKSISVIHERRRIVAS